MSENRGGGSAYLLSEVGGLAEAERLRAQASMVLAAELEDLLAALPKNGQVVDLGCGSGVLADAIAAARPDATVLGIDADAMAVAEARRLFGSRENLSFFRAKVQDEPSGGLPLADVAVMRLVLMHLPHAEEALACAQRWIKASGELHLYEGDDRSIRTEPASAVLPKALQIMQDVQVQRGGSRHLGRELERLLAASGWKVRGRHLRAPDAFEAAFAMKKVFLPVVDFYLRDAERRGMIELGQAEEMSGQLLAEAGSLKSVTLNLYHVWAAR